MRKKTMSLSGDSSFVSKIRANLNLTIFALLMILIGFVLPAYAEHSLRVDALRKGVDIYTNGKSYLLPLSYNPSAVALDREMNRLYIANPGGSLEVYDADALLFIASISIPRNASALAVNAGKVYVTSGRDLTLMDAASGRTLASRNLGATISSMALDSGKGRVFIATFSGSILMLDSSILSSRLTFSDATFRPLELALSSNHSKLFVRDRVSVSVLDPETLQWKNYLSLDGLPQQMQMNSDESLLYVSLSNEKSIAVFDIALNSLTDWYSTDGEWNGKQVDAARWHIDSRLHLFTVDGAEVLPEELKEVAKRRTDTMIAANDANGGPEIDLSSIGGSKDFLSLDATGSGGFVGSWTSLDAKDGSGQGVFAREYSSNGSATKKEFVVNEDTAGDQGNSTVAAGSGGDYVIVWRDSEGNDGEGFGVFYRRFSNGQTGKDQGDKKLSSITAGSQKMTSVDSEPNGDYVATWTGPNGTKKSVFARRFTSSGNPQGNDQEVDSSPDSEWNPDIATNSSGRYAVVWRDAADNQIRGRVYDGSGNPVTSVFKVGSSNNPQFAPSVGMDDSGDFAVAWQENSANSILFRLFAANGNPKSSPQKTTNVGDKDYAPSLSMNGDGKFCIAWRDNSLTLWARSFDASGNPTTSEFKASSSGGDQLSPACATDKDGDFLVGWKARGGGGDTIIKGRKFSPTGGGGGGGGNLDVSCTADPQSGDAPLKVNFTSSPTGGTGEYTYDWNFDDGSDHVTDKSPSHKYTADGTFDAKVTVTSGPDSVSCTKTVTVGSGGGGGGGKLNVSCAADPESGDAPLKVSFTATPTGGTGTYSFEWNFDDGSDHNNDKNPSHKFKQNGSFKAKVTVTSGSNKASCKKTITVGSGGGGGGGGDLNITKLSNKAGNRGTNDVGVKVIGKGFADGAKVSFNDSGINVTKVTFLSAQKLKVLVDIQNTAFLGMHDVTVTNPDKKSATGKSLFKVEDKGKYPSPVVSSIDPSNGSSGKSMSVKIKGQDFANDLSALSADFGDGITAKDFKWTSPTDLSVTLDIDAGAECGSRDVVVSNGPSHSQPCTDCFAVQSGKLQVNEVSPSSLPAGSTNSVVTIKGSNFNDSSVAKIKGTETVSQTVIDCGTIELTINIPQDANRGDKKVKVSNSGGDSASKTGVFEITD